MSQQSPRQPLAAAHEQHADAQGDDEDVHYTAFVRLPFPRQDFVDPPLVSWPAQKDRELWRILSQAPPGRQGMSNELEWKRLAVQFDVSVTFILQQAAWLYERQLSQVRAQMRKVGGGRPLSGNYSATGMPGGRGSVSGSPSPAMAAGAGGAERMSRPSSSSLGSKGTDAGQDGGQEARPLTLSRIPSTATVTQSRQQIGFRTGSAGVSRAGQVVAPARERRPPELAQPSPYAGEAGKDDSSAVDNLANSSSESDEDEAESEEALPARSQLFRRQLQHRRGIPTGKTARLVEDEEEGGGDGSADEAPAFLPFSGAGSGAQDLGATVRTAEDDASKTSSDAALVSAPAAAAVDKGKQRAAATASSNMSEASSASSTGLVSAAASHGRRAGVRAGGKKEGSEGTPSMGSSFSDLEDTSVTQSAMEEYYLSKMQHGAASRMSSFGQALKSRYLPPQKQ